VNKGLPILVIGETRLSPVEDVEKDYIMKFLLLSFVFLLVVIGNIAVAQQPSQEPPADIAGKWTIYSGNTKGEPETKYIELRQDGNVITSHFQGPNQSGPLEGTINEQHILFRTKTPNVLTFRGRVEADFTEPVAYRVFTVSRRSGRPGPDFRTPDPVRPHSTGQTATVLPIRIFRPMGGLHEREEDYGSQEGDQEAGETQEARTDQAAPGFSPPGYRVIAEVPLTVEPTLPTLDPALVLFDNYPLLFRLP
jgi:hypothetical protein